MRLIDIDAVNGTFVKNENYRGSEIIALLNQQPTAYDVDKVMKQIKEEIAEMPEYKHKFCESKEVEHCMQYERCEDCMAKRIIEIVKSGGIE